MKILDNFVFIYLLSFSLIFSLLNLEGKKKKKNRVGLGENYSIHHISNSLPLFQPNSGKHIFLSFPFLNFHFPNS